MTTTEVTLDTDEERRLKEIRRRDLDKLSAELIKRCIHVHWKWGERTLLYFNPITTFLSAAIIWAFVIYCIVMPTQSNDSLKLAKAWVTDVWTWLYVGTQDVWAFFIIVLFFSKYANLKLGRDDEKPEYPDGTYFTMLFSCGIGIGFIYYGVAEPIFHYRVSPNRYWGKHTDNVRAQDAINLTLFHWGIHGWVVYVIIGLLLGFLSYRRGLPMTMRTIFYPIMGDKIFGRIGDLIDTLCIVCTMFGVCTSLGLGVMQLNTNLRSINPNIPDSIHTQLVIICCITGLATVSVISGIKVGIRRLSEICFLIGCLLLIIVFFADKPWYILNLFVQSIGYYFQWIIQLGFHTDAFAQLGIAPDKEEHSDWLDGWTIFYWGCWVSFSPFVGMFIAKISRGRTIREFITYTLTLPCAYSFIWFSVFGGSAIRMQNTAENANLTCALYSTECTVGYDSAKYTSRAWAILAEYGTNKLECFTSTDMWFVFIRSYDGIGMFMEVVSLIAIILYFITTSDSGSLVIDLISANGFKEPPVIQRIFWALTEGACATALLVAGGKDSLYALHSVSVICGLPFTFVLNWTCVSMWRAVREEAGEIDVTYGKWDSSVWDWNSWRKLKTVLISIPCPWIVLTLVRMKLDKKTSLTAQVLNILFYAVPFYLWIILICLVKVGSVSYVGWAILIIFFAFASALRSEIRDLHDIEGNMIEDFFAFMLLYPLTCMQISEQLLYGLSLEERRADQMEMSWRVNAFENDPRINTVDDELGT